MDRRSRFALILGLFVVWVAVLGYLAMTSAEKPQQRGVPADVR
jgi:hypothetical protein